MIQVTAAIIEKDGQYLIARRKVGHLAGLWEFPGGKIEEGELPEECLRREIDEEFGMEIEILEYLATSKYTYPHIAIELMGYLAKYCGGDMRLSDHDLVEWVTPATMDHYEFAPADVPLIKALQARVRVVT